MTAVKLFKIRRGERTFRRLDEGSGISLTETIDDRIIIAFDGTFSGDLVIDGNLTVNGDTTTINSTTHDINDNVIVLNDGEIGAGVVTLGNISGFEVDRGTLNNNVRWVWFEPDDLFRPEFAAGGATHVGEFLDPTLGTHVGDRDFNDARYLQNVVEDTSPTLGGNLDANTFDIVEDGNVILSFTSDSEFAVNWVDIKHAATGSGPIIRSVGADTNVDLNLSSKGTGVIKLNGTKTNAFTDADESKLDGIEALADVTDATNVNAAGAVMETDYDAQTILIAVVDDTPLPVTVAASTFVGRKATGNVGTMTVAEALTLLNVEVGADVTDATNVNAAGAVMETDYDAQTILIAVVDDTPLPVTVAASTFVGRKATGNVGTMTVAEALTLLNVEAGAAADQNLWATFNADSGTTTANTTTDTLIVSGGTGISTSITGDTLTITTPALLNVVDDGTPQLGAQLDVNTFGLGDGTNLLLDFVEDASAVNHIEIENEATGSGPIIRAVGADTNIDLKLTPKGTGAVSVAEATDYENNVTADDDIPNKKFCDDTYAPLHDTINAQTGTTYTLVLTDDGKLVTMDNASANTLTIPTNASVAFPIGTRIDIIMKGAATTTVTGFTGVTVNGVSAGGATIDAQFKGVTVRKAATDTWFMIGAHGTVA